MTRSTYFGKNGQEYLNEFDAEVYGGGLVSERTDMGTVERKVKLTPKQKKAVDEKKKANAEVIFNTYGDFKIPDDTEEVETDVEEVDAEKMPE